LAVVGGRVARCWLEGLLMAVGGCLEGLMAIGCLAMGC
jgi:hypothetical protein